MKNLRAISSWALALLLLTSCVHGLKERQWTCTELDYHDANRLLVEHKYDEAIAAYNGITSACENNNSPPLEPDTSQHLSRVYTNLAIAYYQTNRYQESEQSCRMALEYDPQNYKAQNNLGVLLYQVGHKEEAKRLIKRAQELSDSDAYIHYNDKLLRKTRN